MDEFTRCSACCRTPLIGEEVTLIRSAEREAAICDLCLERPRSAVLGEAVRRERISSAAGAESVRRVWPQPARVDAGALAGSAG